MPNDDAPISLADTALAKSSSQTILVSNGPGAIPSSTADVSPLTVQPSTSTTPLALAVLNGYAKNCQHYGAKGDGTTDDTAALQATVNAAGVNGAVYIPAGVYRTTSAIACLSGQFLYGDGAGRTTIKANARFPRILSLDTKTNVVFRDLFLDGNNQVNGPCIGIGGSTDCFIEGVRMTGGEWGVLVLQSQRISVIACQVDDTTVAHGVEINGSDDCLIMGCNLHSAAANAIELYQAGTIPEKGTRVIGNWLKGDRPSGSSGLACFGLIKATIANNTITGCTGYGIFLTFGEVTSSVLSHGVSVTGNAVRDCGQSGIQLNGGYGYTFTGNVTTGNAVSGIVANLCDLCTFTSNVSWSNGQAGIYINGGSKHIATGNMCFDNPASGINVQNPSASVFSGNSCTNKFGTTQPYGILLSAATNCTVSDNTLTGNATNALSVSGSDNRVYNNLGNSTDAWTVKDGKFLVGATAVGAAAGMIEAKAATAGTNAAAFYASDLSSTLVVSPKARLSVDKGSAPITSIEVGTTSLSAHFASGALPGGAFVNRIGISASSGPTYDLRSDAGGVGKKNSRWINNGTANSFQVVDDGYTAVLMTPLAWDNGTGVISIASGLNVGAGTVLTRILSATATLAFGSTAAGESSDLTITVSGAAVGNAVSLGLPASPSAKSCFTGWVSATDTVTVRFNNYSSSPITPASGVYRATVFKT